MYMSTYNENDYSNYNNIFIGDVAFNAENVEERGTEPVIPPALGDVEYVVDVFAKKDSLHAMIDNVEVKYAEAGDDFNVVDSSTDHSNVKSQQFADGQTFNFNRGVECVGRMPSNLRGKFLPDAGADNVALAEAAKYLDIDGEVLSNAALSVAYNTNVGDAAYDDKNLAASALPRALSAQMPGTGGDENLLRIMVKPDGYFNLLKFALGGAKDENGDVKNLNNLVCSKESVTGDSMELDDALNSSDANPDDPNSRLLGHEILLAIFNENNPNAANCGPQSANKLWALDGDCVRLNNTDLALEREVNLQFILETKLTMNLRNGTAVSTAQSPAPATGEADNSTVKILFNVIFSRSGDTHMDIGNASYTFDAEDFAIDVDGATINGMPPAN